jgi:hypothetical protein
MTPTVQNDATLTQGRITIIQTIHPICHAVATFVTLGNNRTPYATQVRALGITALGIGTAYPAFFAAAAV